MIDLKIDNQVIKTLRAEGLYPDTLLTQLFILYCTYHNLSMDSLDDSITSKRFILQYYELVRKGLLVESELVSGFILTDRGRELVEKIAQIWADNESKDEINIKEWLELFPKGVKTGGKLLRSDAKGCLTKMKTFMKSYKYSWEEIMSATKAYLDDRAKDDYMYTRAAIYFIGKNGQGSTLAEWCEKIKEQKEEELPFEPVDNII